MNETRADLETEGGATGPADLGSVLEWMRLSGLLRREHDLMRRLLYLLLRQRETIALMNFAEFQKAVLDQIQLLQELENVRGAVEEEVELLGRIHLRDSRPGLARLLPFAPEESRSQLEETRGKVERLAVEIQRISRRNRMLLATLGELRAKQYETVMEAAGLLQGTTYGERSAEGPQVSLCDVVA